MSVNVASGLVVVDGTQDTTHQGSYVCLNDAVVNLTIAAADPTNPRIDIVVAQVQDSQYSGATDAWKLAVVTGTPAPSPSAPALPANAVLLANVAVAANATSIVSANITDKRLFVGSTPFRARAFQSTIQSIPNATFTKLTIDTVSYDPNSNLDVVTNHRYTAPVTGYYRVTGSVLMASAATGLIAKIYVNGSPVTASIQGTLLGGLAADEIHLNAGDFVEVFVSQSSGAAVNTVPAAPQTCYLAVTYTGS